MHPYPPESPPKTGHNAQYTQPLTVTVTHPHKGLSPKSVGHPVGNTDKTLTRIWKALRRKKRHPLPRPLTRPVQASPTARCSRHSAVAYAPLVAASSRQSKSFAVTVSLYPTPAGG